GYPF
ncbi:dihydroxyacetone kinase, L subunit, partial [Vibrio parahaemolyticus V-223/04]